MYGVPNNSEHEDLDTEPTNMQSDKITDTDCFDIQITRSKIWSVCNKY